MKSKYFPPIAGVLVLAALAAWAAFAFDQPAESPPEGTTSTFRVTGMTCSGCEVALKRVVKKLDGVTEVEASHAAGTAKVTYLPKQVTPSDIIAAIEGLGYTAELADEKEPT